MSEWFRLTTDELDTLKRLEPYYGIPIDDLDRTIVIRLKLRGLVTTGNREPVRLTAEGYELLESYFNAMRKMTDRPRIWKLSDE